MTTKILMLGNGFDLSYKLPTSYLCFIKTIKFIVENKTSSVGSVGDIFRKIAASDKNINDSFQKYRLAYEECSVDKDKLERISSLARENCWFDFFCRSISSDIKWIDFEAEIKKAIRCFQMYFEENLRVYQGHDSSKKYMTASVLAAFCSIFSVTTFSNGKNITLKEKYTKLDSLSDKRLIDKEKIVTFLFDSLVNFSQILDLYLQVFVDAPLRLSYEKGLLQTKDYLSDYDDIVTFNYTKTYEILYDESNTGKNVPLINRIFHIHGETEGKIILGVNPDIEDSVENIDISFVGFKKYYQRIAYQTDIAYLKRIEILKASTELGDEVSLCVFGHSLDETDRDIIVELFELADKIKILCYCNNAMYEYIKRIINIFGKDGLDRLRAEKDLCFEVISE